MRYPDYAHEITIEFNNDTAYEGYIQGIFPNNSLQITSKTKGMFKSYVNENINIMGGTLTFNLYHKACLVFFLFLIFFFFLPFYVCCLSLCFVVSVCLLVCTHVCL